MKIVLDNIIFFLQRSGGMSVYWYEMISRMNDSKKFETKYLEPSDTSRNIFYKTIRSEIKSKIVVENWKSPLLSFLRYKGKEQEKHIFHSSYYRTSVSKNAINVVTIHDFIPEFFFSRFRKFIHAYRKRRAILNADGIVCISKNTSNDLLKFYPEIRNKPVKVIYNGVSNDYYPFEKKTDGNPEKNILFVGKRPPYKNFAFAIDIIDRLKDYHLVIVGDKLSDKELQALSKIRNSYTFVENPDNAALNRLYNSSHCLLYPSAYEGFGIPVIEAMKAGCPVVALNAGAVGEIAKGAALLADKLDVSEFVSKILSLEDGGLRYDIIKRGIENAKQFDWDKCFRELISFYESLYVQKVA